MPHGAISWVEIPASDLERDPGFYEQVFGWKITRDQGMPGYVMFSDGSSAVGGGMYREIKPSPEGGPQIYITVDSIDDALKAIEAAGGATIQERTLISDNVGWWAGFRDPAGNRMFLYEENRAEGLP